MNGLRSADLRKVLGAGHDLGGVSCAADFPAAVIAVMGQVLPSDIPSYNELDLRTHTMVAAAPRRVLFPDAEKIAGRYAYQDPTVSYFDRTADGSAVVISDFITQRALHKLDMYDLIYRRVGLEYAIALVLPPRGSATRSATTQTRLVFGRASSDFGERDRAVLNALRPFLARTKHALEALDELRATIRDLREAASTGERLILALDSSGHVAEADAAATELLCQLGSPTGTALPEPLRSWTREHLREPARDRSMVVNGPQGPLIARLLHGFGDEPSVLVLDRPSGELSLSSLAELGLSKREALVLRAIAGGHSNTEVARQLAISKHTVAKHLQHIYAKLEVTNRTAAVQAARGEPTNHPKQARTAS